jgi:hypothetical protein
MMSKFSAAFCPIQNVTLALMQSIYRCSIFMVSLSEILY